MHTIFGLLTNPASTDSGGRMSYFQVILKLLEIADHSPSLVDFYWPQVPLSLPPSLSPTSSLSLPLSLTLPLMTLLIFMPSLLSHPPFLLPHHLSSCTSTCARALTAPPRPS